MPETVKNPFVSHWMNNLQFHLAGSGYVQAGQEWRMEAADAAVSCVCYLLRGTGWAQRDGVRTPLRAGRISLIPPGGAVGCAGHGELLYFCFHILPRQQGDPPPPFDRVVEMPCKQSRLERLAGLYQSADPRDALAVVQQLYQDTFSLLRRAGPLLPLPAACSGMVQQTLLYVRGHLSARLTIADVSRALSVPVSTLSKRFRREMDLPLGAYMDSQLFQKARQMLLFSDLSIGEIADALEFCDSFYFSRYFKLHQQETPSRFRKRMRETE